METVFQRARAGLDAYPTASPLVRGGLTLVAGVLTGNILGFARVAIIAYLLGTHSRADSLAVAMGPLDTLNSVVLNSVVFAFVPMLTAVTGGERTALFQKLTRAVAWVLTGIPAWTRRTSVTR
jgi:peptidoglycan biosynthesis protein MviN/MurJ (putative lipid II flippase)